MSNNVFLQGMREATKKWKQEAEKWFHKRAKEIMEQEINTCNTLKKIQEYIMKREEQDKRWNELSKESKTFLIEQYNSYGLNDTASVASRRTMEELFGSHNLNPKQIKIWEDVEKEYGDFGWCIGGNTSIVSGILTKKVIATLKIAKLIELGYGGMVSEEEWKDIDVEKWCIIPCNKINDIQRVVFYFHSDKRFIAFHTEQQAEEFMSYESNRKLVEQYHAM